MQCTAIFILTIPTPPHTTLPPLKDSQMNSYLMSDPLIKMPSSNS